MTSLCFLGLIDLLKTAIQEFARVSGLHPNLNKSQIFFGNVGVDTKRDISNLLNIPEGSLPVRYLGIPLIMARLSHMDSKVLVDKLVSRTSSWISNSLSFGGRQQLIAYVLFSIQVFWCNTFMLPVAVTKECDRILRGFFWHGVGTSKRGGKIVWSKVCRPMATRGLGFKDSRSWNWATIIKIGWDIFRGKESVWMNWCRVVRLKDNSFWAAPVTKACSWSWRNILLSRRFLIPSVLYEVRDGNFFSLWYDPWVLGDSIINRFGERVIYELGIPRNALISNFISEGRWDWPTFSGDLIELSNITAAIPLPAGGDKVHWISSVISEGRWE
ncbi:hypothetical protein CFOL_v3_18774 [Cephalotus follicularis]|uniref:Zf-RVT domain-containing protein n=1 Tax=Cephalotus follicularis TaxID=3775 RepID=A0A1Q3C4Y1_CEPFO|nr:hypothetical protein CFOL_v3_18774 [Cephalotus follicularis]